MGVYLSEPNKTKNINIGENSKLSFISAEMQGWRKTMEDAAIHELDIGNNNSLFAVFDGHGGSEISKFVSNIFVKELTNNKSYQEKNYMKALDETFMRIDEVIQSIEGQYQLRKIKYASENIPETKQEFIGSAVGCTANVILITPETYYIANAGDSRSVLCKDGKAVAFSEDHKPQSVEQQDRIKKAGGVIYMGRVNGGLNLTRSFADFDYKKSKDLSYDKQMITCKPDIKQIPRSKGDEFILLGCDGIWQKYVENSQGIIDIVRKDIEKTKNNQKVVQNLLEELLATDTNLGLGCDNMTAILIVIKN